MQSPRIEGIVTAFHGDPCDLLEDKVSNVKDSLSTNQSKRLESAIKEKICIYPERTGLYRIHTFKEQKNKFKSYTVDIKYEEAKTCTCEDFMFSLEASKGQMCKHIWKTHILITLGVLPEPDEEPYDWFLNEIKQDINFLKGISKNEALSPNVERMVNLKEEFENTHKIAVDYPDFGRKRADIVSHLID